MILGIIVPCRIYSLMKGDRAFWVAEDKSYPVRYAFPRDTTAAGTTYGF